VHLKRILEGLGARFPKAAMVRMAKAIRDGKPIEPPDAEGWDVGALLMTASALAARAASLMRKKAPARRRNRCKA
jgi:hypothetical protein